MRARDLQTTAALVVLASVVPSTEAAIGLNDPLLCYILDGVLLLYGLVITALFFREKYFRPKANSKEDGIYMGLSQPADPYDVLRSLNDAEGGAAASRGNRRRTGDETYTALQKPTDDEYKEIGVKKERRRNEKKEQVYQGLSGNKATYDALHMQPLPPRK